MRTKTRQASNRSDLPRWIALAAFVACLAAGASGPIRAQVLPGEITLELDQVASGLTSPIIATHAGDGSGRLFVADQVGRIRIIQGGTLLPDTFLDLSGEMVELNSFFDERGLLGVAFHPNYECNGRFFVRYSRARDGGPAEPCFGTSRGCHEEVLAEFRVSDADPDVADPAGTILYRIDQPQFNHNAGHVAFGPDGYLYFSLGDGGGAHDGLADVPPSHGPIGNGQNLTTALGSMLRIDVDAAPQPPRAYAIPPDNPFVNGGGLEEIYAYGLRNPYRFSFDRGDDEDDDQHAAVYQPRWPAIADRGDTDATDAQFGTATGRNDPTGGSGHGCDDDSSDDDEDDDAMLLLADVGQNRLEEIDIIVKGGNYGWVIREGSSCFDPLNPLDPPDTCSSQGVSGEPLIDPLAEYDHADGIAIVGGFVYRGAQFPGLVGKYVFGDFSRGFIPGNGRLFYLDLQGDPSEIFEFRLPGDLDLNRYVLGFGEDERGELYLLTSESLGPSGETGAVFHIGVAGGNDDESSDEGDDDGFADFSSIGIRTGDEGFVHLGERHPEGDNSTQAERGEDLVKKSGGEDRRSRAAGRR